MVRFVVCFENLFFFSPKDNQTIRRSREIAGVSDPTANGTLEVSPAEQGPGSNSATLAGQTRPTSKVHIQKKGERLFLCYGMIQ